MWNPGRGTCNNGSGMRNPGRGLGNQHKDTKAYWTMGYRNEMVFISHSWSGVVIRVFLCVLPVVLFPSTPGFISKTSFVVLGSFVVGLTNFDGKVKSLQWSPKQQRKLHSL